MARHRFWLVGLAVVAIAAILVVPRLLVASDHDDGETDTKGRNVNLTDLYAFREGDQTGNAAQNSNLILVMNTNPRSVARQQYYFSARARYEFRIERAVSNSAAPTAAGLSRPDIILRFEFGEPVANKQSIKVTAIRDGVRMVATGAVTTPLPVTADTPTINTVTLGGSQLDVYAGLREDPFFFDVEQFFRVRAGLAGLGPSVGFRNPGLDFTSGYNVNSIVVRVPIAFLQGATTATTFDVWETISVRTEDDDNEFMQVDRLARPAINEGLVITNDFLNRMNQVGPDCEALALAGQQPCAGILGPVFTEAIGTLTALGNSSTRVGQLVAAFLPDVMRIDTTQASGYAAGFGGLNGPATLTRGRLLKDDVIDATLFVLTNGVVTSDGVSYDGPNLDGRGHKPLRTTFPYLATPN